MTGCNWPYTCAKCSKLDRILDNQEQACVTCCWFGPEADMVPICHKFLKEMFPCDWCGEWESKSWNRKSMN